MPKTAPSKPEVRRGRPPVRGPRQHQDLLDIVATRINLHGPGSIVLADIGAPLGLSRSSVYYYCTDAADLAHQAYLKSSALMAQDIAAAAAQAGTASEQVTAFIHRVLDPGHPPMAAMNDVDFLPEAKRLEVQAVNARNAESLRLVLQAGQKAGEFRGFDAALGAHLLLNVLSWAMISLPWLERRNDDQGRRRYIDAICDVLLNGAASPGAQAQPCDMTFDQLMHRMIDAFDKTQTAELKAEQIMAAASRLFNLKGLDGVRLEQVSAEIGATKGAIYHHFRDKAELIERCYERAFDIYDLILRTSLAADASPLSRAMFVTHLNTQAQLSPNAPLALQPGLGNLRRARRTRFMQRAKDIRRGNADNLRLAFSDGSCRITDIDPVTELVAGYFLGIQRWAPAGMAHHAISDMIVDLALHGFKGASGALQVRRGKK